MKKIRQSIAVKSISGIVLLLVLFSVFVSTMGSSVFTNAMLTQYTEGAFITADTAALVIDPDRIDAYAASEGKTAEYLDVWDKLDMLCNSSGATFIYLIQPDLTDYRHITFLFSTINDDSEYTVYDFGYVRETTNDEYREKYKALYDGTSDREYLIRDKGYIETDAHITAMIPLKGSDGQTKAILCVQRQMDILLNARNSYMNKVILILLVLAVIIIVGQGIYLNKVFLQPVQTITAEATRFAEENTARKEKLSKTIKNRDEIGLIAGSIDQMETQICDYVENLTRITAQNERINTELSLATRIQAEMLPNAVSAFPNRSEFNIFAVMDPAREVGGDFYDFFLIDQDHLCLIMADVSGKGIPAALFMMASKIILADNAKMGKTPAQILESTNDTLCLNNIEQMFITVWIGILELSTGNLTAANAGHEYPIVKQAGGDFELLRDKHGFVIGGMEGMKYFEYTIHLEPGSQLFLYTDGVPESTNSAGNMFGTDRMLKALNAETDVSPERLLKNVQSAADIFVEEAEQFDDFTMMCIEYLGDNGIR